MNQAGRVSLFVCYCRIYSGDSVQNNQNTYVQMRGCILISEFAAIFRPSSTLEPNIHYQQRAKLLTVQISDKAVQTDSFGDFLA